MGGRCTGQLGSSTAAVVAVDKIQVTLSSWRAERQLRAGLSFREDSLIFASF